MSRKPLPDTRKGVIHKIDIAGTEGYIATGEYEDGTLGEIFLTISKQGSTLSGILDSLAITTSIALQYGVPLKALCDKLCFMRFEPMGATNDKEIHFATSITDLIFRWLAKRYLSEEEQKEIGLLGDNDEDSRIENLA